MILASQPFKYYSYSSQTKARPCCTPIGSQFTVGTGMNESIINFTSEMKHFSKNLLNGNFTSEMKHFSKNLLNGHAICRKTSSHVGRDNASSLSTVKCSILSFRFGILHVQFIFSTSKYWCTKQLRGFHLSVHTAYKFAVQRCFSLLS